MPCPSFTLDTRGLKCVRSLLLVVILLVPTIFTLDFYYQVFFSGRIFGILGIKLRLILGTGDLFVIFTTIFRTKIEEFRILWFILHLLVLLLTSLFLGASDKVISIADISISSLDQIIPDWANAIIYISMVAIILAANYRLDKLGIPLPDTLLPFPMHWRMNSATRNFLIRVLVTVLNIAFVLDTFLWVLNGLPITGGWIAARVIFLAFDLSTNLQMFWSGGSQGEEFALQFLANLNFSFRLTAGWMAFVNIAIRRGGFSFNDISVYTIDPIGSQMSGYCFHSLVLLSRLYIASIWYTTPAGLHLACLDTGLGLTFKKCIRSLCCVGLGLVPTIYIVDTFLKGFGGQLFLTQCSGFLVRIFLILTDLALVLIIKSMRKFLVIWLVNQLLFGFLVLGLVASGEKWISFMDISICWHNVECSEHVSFATYAGIVAVVLVLGTGYVTTTTAEPGPPEETELDGIVTKAGDH